MASKKKTNILQNWQENYASFILGAIIVVILGLLVANFFSQKNQSQINDGVSTEETMEASESAGTNPGEYKVQANDSLSKIAEREYGDKMLWPAIARENNISNPNLIYVDMNIKLPSKDDVAKMAEAMTITSYDVVEGDTLFKIAEKVYGDGNHWGRIAEANNVGRLPNGNPLIFAGSTLSIPR